MKIFSTASMAALLFGASAIMQSAPVKAELPVGTCYQLALECDEGNQEACEIYDRGCRSEAPQGSILSSTPPAKGND
jgi:hypothetical protein